MKYNELIWINIELFIVLPNSDLHPEFNTDDGDTSWHLMIPFISCSAWIHGNIPGQSLFF